MPDYTRSSRPGPRRLPKDVVKFDQRERLMTALATVVHEKGYERTTITDIVTTAAIARKTFYEHFADREDCFLATFYALDRHSRSLMEAACEREGGAEWPDRVAATLAAALDFFSQNPEAARVLLVDSAGLGEAIRPRVDAYTDWLVARLGQGRPPEVTAGAGLTEPIDEAIVTGVRTVLANRISAGQEDVTPLIGEVIESVLGPYVGFDRAREVAARHS